MVVFLHPAPLWLSLLIHNSNARILLIRNILWVETRALSIIYQLKKYFKCLAFNNKFNNTLTTGASGGQSKQEICDIETFSWCWPSLKHKLQLIILVACKAFYIFTVRVCVVKRDKPQSVWKTVEQVWNCLSFEKINGSNCERLQRRMYVWKIDDHWCRLGWCLRTLQDGDRMVSRRTVLILLVLDDVLVSALLQDQPQLVLVIWPVQSPGLTCHLVMIKMCNDQSHLSSHCQG